MDAFTSASWTGQRARATCVRDRSAPIVMPRQMAGHMPDPRVPANDWSRRPDIGRSTDRASLAGAIIRGVVIIGLFSIAVVALWVSL